MDLSSQIQIILIDLLPSFLFLFLQLLLLFKSRFFHQNLKDDEKESIITDFMEKENREEANLSVSYYVHYKLSFLLSLLYLFDVIYAIFFANPDWFLPKTSFVVYFYLLAALAWVISCKQNDWSLSDDPYFKKNLRLFWIFSFAMQVLALICNEKEEIFLTLLLKLCFSFILLFYALGREDDKEKCILSDSPKTFIRHTLEQIITKFEENFYIRVIFLGRNYEKFLRKEIELNDIEIHSTMNMNLSFSDVKKKEKGFVKKLSDKNYLNELEEQEFLSYLPSIQILVWKEPEKSLPYHLKNYDPSLFFVVYSYLTWDLDNRMEFKVYRKLSEFMEIEKKLNDFYVENAYFNRPIVEFQRFSLLDCDSNADLLYKKRALTLERFFNFVLLREKHLIHPLILDFLEVAPEEKKAFQAYYNFLIKQKIVRNNKRNSKKPRGTLNTIDSPLVTENIEEDYISESSCSMPIIPLNYLLFEVKLASIWKFPNEPLESNITMEISEKNINYDWEITRKFIDFVNLHHALKTKNFYDQPEFVNISQKMTPLLQVKENTLNYFFNFEVIKKDLIEYISFLVTNSQYHCNEVFNFIEFDPNAMKRFVLGKNLNKFLQPTQTVRTFTNDSQRGVMHQHCSVLDQNIYGTYNTLGTNNANINNEYLLPLNRIGTNINVFNNGSGPFMKNFKRTYTNQGPGFSNNLERKYDGFCLSDRHHEGFSLQNFFASVSEIKKNSDGTISFVICLNEYISDKINKIKSRVIFKKSKEEIKMLYQTIIEHCDQNRIPMSMPLRNIEILEEEKEDNVKNGVEIYLNEVIKLSNISKNKKILDFFHFEKIRLHFKETKDQGNMVLDLREK